ncbi:aminopeptidase N-like [Paramormyrops kingsleyae]|uniref:aminopeptidase N-like n=1 Tax=Paramormyrops kingsleyae TaxID=1676925 RepID=UPI003B97BEE1
MGDVSKKLAKVAAVVVVVIIIVLCIVFGKWSSSKDTSQPRTLAWDNFRLPDSLLPKSYNVTLWPRLQKNKQGTYIFTGASSVIFTCAKETNLILIHCHKLNLTMTNGFHATLTSLGGESTPSIITTRLQEQTQYLVIQLNGNLAVGKFYSLKTKFKGELADDMEGFYRSEYEEDGVKKIVATTQMQATYARKAFPCFDEPTMKASFYITIIHERGTVALSNGMDIESVNMTINNETVTRTTFEPTPQMSTYLLAFIVSDYTYISSAKKDNALIRIWARRKAISRRQGQYALNVTGQILQFFVNYYKSPYPLSKSDQVALPDFQAGAMENWGLITYRESSLLYDSAISSNGNKERVATVIAHELAHMWFGNLVTLKWWNDLWLNEGFATYVSYLGVDYAAPAWNINDLIVLYDVHKALAFDSLASSHPLSSKAESINKPEEISQMFNTISYSKGAAVLRMLSAFLTESVFVKGLRTYLSEFAFKNTIASDLWNHLQRAVDQSPNITIPRKVTEIMDRWVLQMGYPVVNINTHTGAVSQQHFLLDPDSKVDRPSEFKYKWFVPVQWMDSSRVVKTFWLLKATDTHKAMKINTGWVLANVHMSGYFRVNYDTDNWEQLLTQLINNHKVIPPINRAQILDDAFNLARAKILSTTLAMRLTKYLSKEREYIPWASAINNLDYFILMFDGSKEYAPLKEYLKKLVTPLFAYLKNITKNWTQVPAGHTDQYLQVTAIRRACRLGLQDCQRLTKDWFNKWMQNQAINRIHPNLRGAVYCSAIEAGGRQEWDFGWKMFQNASVAAEADKLRFSLSCTKDQSLLKRYLDYALDANKIRKQDAISTIVYIASNVEGSKLAWDFVKRNWDRIFAEFGGVSSFSYLINGVTQRFSTDYDLKQFQKFKEEKSKTGFGSGTLALEQVMEKIKANIKWLAKNKAEVMQFLKKENSQKG